MKTHLRIALFTALAAALALGGASCNKGPSPEEQQKQKKEQASNFWKVAGQLVSPFDITEDYEDKTFEPTIGTPAPGDPLTRIVSTNSLRSAVERFNHLVGADITTSTASYTFNDPNVGTLTWTKTSDGKSWGSVDVDIKQIPRLRTIVYQAPEQGNENGKFDGKAYYRFGDIVARDININRGGKNPRTVKEYWICVRPCFGKEGKEKSHWVSVGVLPEDNVFTYNSKNWQGEFYIPDDVGTNEEHMQNFAEFLWAITDPADWERNIGMYTTDGFFGPDGLPFFHDFHKASLEYNNKYFWQNVQKKWQEKGLFQTVLNTSFDQLKSSVVKDGVNLLYYDYTWWTWWDDMLELSQASYTNGTSNEELNLHHAVTGKIEKNVNGIAKLDFSMGMGAANLSDYKPFFGDDKIRWVIRHATGDDLSVNGEHGPQQPLSGVEEIYRYYRDVYQVTDLNDKEGPEITKGASNVSAGWLIGKDGNFYADKSKATQANTTPVALVVYMGSDADASGKFNGLAMAINSDYPQAAWSTNTDNLCVSSTDATKLHTRMDGISATEKLISDGHSHPAATAARNYSVTGFDPVAHGFSRWFLPSAGQIMKVYACFGITSYKTENWYQYLYQVDDVALNRLKVSQQTLGFSYGSFWTSTEVDGKHVAYAAINGDKTANYVHWGKDFTQNKDNTNPVLPFIAF